MRKLSVAIVATLVCGVLVQRAEAAITYGTAYNSGNVYVRHGAATAFPCAGGGTCVSAEQSVTLGTGYDKAEIYMTGFLGKYTQAGSPQNIRIFKVGLEKVSYTSGTGVFKWKLAGEIRASSGSAEPWEVDVHFVIVLTKNAGADVRFHTLGSCMATAGDTCTGTSTLTGAAVNGMDFAGVAIANFSLTRTDGTAGIPIHRMAVDLTSYTISGTDVSLTHTCTFGDASPSGENMACTVYAVTFAANNSETDNSARALTDSAKTAPVATASSDSAGAVNIDGVLGSVAAWDLSFDSSGEHKLWRWEAGFKNISATLGATDFMNYTRIGFLGDTWNSTTTSPFTVVNEIIKVLTLP